MTLKLNDQTNYCVKDDKLIIKYKCSCKIIHWSPYGDCVGCENYGKKLWSAEGKIIEIGNKKFHVKKVDSVASIGKDKEYSFVT